VLDVEWAAAIREAGKSLAPGIRKRLLDESDKSAATHCRTSSAILEAVLELPEPARAVAVRGFLGTMQAPDAPEPPAIDFIGSWGTHERPLVVSISGGEFSLASADGAVGHGDLHDGTLSARMVLPSHQVWDCEFRVAHDVAGPLLDGRCRQSPSSEWKVWGPLKKLASD
jgi:hypothetical protein